MYGEHMAASSVNQSLRRIRIRRYVAFGLLVGFLPFFMAASYLLHWDTAMSAVVFIYFGIFAIAIVAFGFSQCPRCHNFFFFSWWSNPFSSRCMHCGLPISGE